MPVKKSLPLTEAEANLKAIPVYKSVTIEYKELANRLYLPKSTQYYQIENGPALKTTIDYDELGRIYKITNQKNEETNYEYDTAYKWLPSRIYIADPENTGDTQRITETLYGYDEGYGLGATEVKQKYKDGEYSVSKVQYNSNYGQVKSSTDANNATINYTYDWLGRLKSVTYPSYSSETGNNYIIDEYDYGKYSLFSNTWYFSVTKNTYKKANQTMREKVSTQVTKYDDYGNIVYRETDVGEEEFVYDHSNRVTGYKDLRDFGTAANTETYEYDGFNRLKSVTDRVGNKQQVNFKLLSNEYSFLPVGSTTAENHYYEYYDMYGNQIGTKIFPNGITSTAVSSGYEYDYAGNLLKYTDGNSKVTSYQYDELNTVIKIIQANGSVIDTEVTKWGSDSAIKQYDSSNEYSIENTYDDRGLPLTTSQKGLDVRTRPWYYDYREDGKVSVVTEPNGNIKTYDYDEQGHVISYTAGSIADTMKYNHFRQLDLISRTINGENTTTIDYVYNYLGRLEKRIDRGMTTEYDYNQIGSITNVKSPNGLIRTYERDELERIYKVKTDDKEYVYEYYDDGLTKSLTYPTSNISVLYTYDNANRLKTMITKKDSTVLKSYSYTYDNVGNILTISGSDNVTYTYDDLYRLKTYRENAVTTTYDYDNRNNLILETRGNHLKNYEYSGDNRLYRVVEDGVETLYIYDLNGNLINRGFDEFAYDENNRMIYSKVDGVETKYEIGADGLRTSKIGTTTESYYLDNSGNVLQENQSEIIMGDRVLAKKIGTSYYYYIYNAHGDVVMILDEEGDTKNSYSYDPWGNITSQIETIANSHKYAGEYYDSETGFIYLRNRYYDSNIKRFTTEDPIRDGLNWYAYCDNNPIMFWDPWGLGRNVIVIVGSDKSSSNNVFKDNANTFVSENPDDTIKIFYGWEYSSWTDLKKNIKKAFGDSGIDAMVIEAHASTSNIVISSSASNSSYKNISITSSTSWSGIKFNEKANIRVTGCTAGGMAGQTNVITPYNVDEDGNFVSYTGEMKAYTSIAQTIANKTGATVWTMANFTSQKVEGGKYRQTAVDRYGETGILFKLIEKVKGGTIEYNLYGRIEGYFRFDKK